MWFTVFCFTLLVILAAALLPVPRKQTWPLSVAVWLGQSVVVAILGGCGILFFLPHAVPDWLTSVTRPLLEGTFGMPLSTSSGLPWLVLAVLSAAVSAPMLFVIDRRFNSSGQAAGSPSVPLCNSTDSQEPNRTRISAEPDDAVQQGEITLFPATYVSADALERVGAYELGYRSVCQHPREIGVPEVNESLVLDFNNVLFGDQETAVALANKHARRGVLVGIHTYHPQALEAYPLAALPNIIVAKTHRELLAELGRYARLNGRPWQLDAEAVLGVERSVEEDPAAEEEDLLFWLEAAQAEIDGQPIAEPARCGDKK